MILALTQLLVPICLTVPYHYQYQLVLDPRLWLLIFSTLLVASAGYVINDYYDVKIDSINKPKRVTIDRQFSRTTAIWLHTVLNLTGIGLAYFAGLKVAVLTFLSAFLLWVYSNHLKRRPLIGNLLIGILAGLSVLMPLIYLQQHTPIGWVVATLAMVLTWVREVVKDMEDLKGDKTFGCRTLPIAIGLRQTKYVIYGFVLILLVTLAWSILMGWVGAGWMRYHLWLMMPFLLHFVLLLFAADTTGQYRALSRYAKLLMLAGVLSILWYPWS
jgi:4-hydroxybenzoate polyprenyltransferase